MASVLLIVLALFGISAIRVIDMSWCHEAIKDMVGQYWWHEDWDNVPSLQVDANFSWMNAPFPKPLLIAHALGAAGRINANTLGAAKSTLQAGWTHLEVDIWLDDTAQLRCHHGPHSPLILQESDCTFEKLLALTNNTNQWLILDIKTNFEQTGRRILDAAISQKREGILIFQLYRPADVISFGKWQKETQLPAPILTAYASRRSLNELQKQAERLHIKALAFPLDRAIALSKKNPSIALLLHPVHDCSAFDRALIAGASGVYARSDLACPTTFVTP